MSQMWLSPIHSPRAPIGVGSMASGALREKTTLYELQGGMWLSPVFSQVIILRHMTTQSNVFGPLQHQHPFFWGSLQQYEKEWEELETHD